MYKNIEKQTKLQLKDLVEYQPGQVISKTLVQNEKVSMTIFSFDKGEEISTHAAGICACSGSKVRSAHSSTFCTRSCFPDCSAVMLTVPSGLWK